MGQGRRNMGRDRRTPDALKGLNGKLDAVRDAAAQGAREPLEQFVAAVHERLSLEHRRWPDTAESTRALMAKFDE